MTACQERIAVRTEINFDDLVKVINDFIKHEVSKVVDLRVNSVNELNDQDSSETATTVHYAYLRYIPI